MSPAALGTNRDGGLPAGSAAAAASASTGERVSRIASAGARNSCKPGSNATRRRSTSSHTSSSQTGPQKGPSTSTK
eukprot:CAMPEP_0119325102 /NCGR_PEP_ID=MMETSP1333-20130426/64989_1 /TAXON_ID=418940 /ORGANISM="Scyphosphaera apsteinii, Strain RCC1455" /LENGTH=75 /DNA_ID=CAMNT_0007332987 /DNA_START=20 /DNA_END=247 /DNA_ORIENTATION=-